MTKNINFSAKISLSFLWFFTGLTSAFFAPDIGYQILANGNITGGLATFSIFSGSVLDFIIGIWLLTGKSLKNCYIVQMIVILVYSLLLTLIEPNFWLHPFGPLTKNIPLFILIYCLYRYEFDYKNK